MYRIRLFWPLVLLIAAMAVAAGPGDEPAHPGWLRLDERTPLLDRTWSTDPDKFTFAIIGDKWSGGEDKWPVFDRAVEEISLLRPDFAIMVGDLIPGHMLDREEWDREWAEFFGHANRLRVPLLFFPGNHDISNPQMYQWWRQDFGRTYYSFDYQRCHFLALNTEEDRLDGRGEVWEAMMHFAEEDLAEHRGVRHTFVFMHKPMWIDERYEEDWPRIERALGDRPHTVIAGHWHTLQTERRNGNLYAVVAATGAGLSPSPIRELGEFDHYTLVTVDGDSVRFAAIEPGGKMWPLEVATRSFQEGLMKLVRIEADAPEELDGRGSAVVRTRVTLSNPLPESTTVVMRLVTRGAVGWERVAGPDSFSVTLRPGEVRQERYAFLVDEAHLTPLPGLSSSIRYRGEWIGVGRGGYLPLYPDSMLRVAPDWMVIGPFDIGPINARLLPERPQEGLPGLFSRTEPARFWDVEQPVIERGRTYRWRRVRPQKSGEMNFNGYVGTQDHAVAYAGCHVHSPVEQTVYVSVQADNFAQVLLNGELLGGVYDRVGTPLFLPVRLRPGWNALVVRLVNNSGDWWLSLRVADPMRNLRFSVAPE